MPTTNTFIHAESFQFRKGTRKQGRCAGRQRLIAQLRSEIEPADRLYKLSREAASHTFGRLELIAFLFFGVLVSAATVYCGTELFHLLVSGSVEHVVQALLPR
jgi:hypothetical protein